MFWYSLRVISGKEKSAEEQIIRAAGDNEITNEIEEVFVPYEKVVEMRNNKKKIREKMFFPGYVLVNMNLNDETWHFVNSIPNVMGFVGGSSEKPAPISDREVMIILNKAEDAANAPRPKITYQPGEVVRVIEGPFNDFNGVVEKVNYEKNKLSVAVQILGRATPVELNFNQVEKS